MSKITKAANGRDCQVRLTNYCNFNPETTVPAHRPGGGVAGKTPDYQIAFACSNCHDIIDGRNTDHYFTADEIYRYFADGVWRTQEILREMGLIEVSK